MHQIFATVTLDHLESLGITWHNTIITAQCRVTEKFLPIKGREGRNDLRVQKSITSKTIYATSRIMIKAKLKVCNNDEGGVGCSDRGSRAARAAGATGAAGAGGAAAAGSANTEKSRAGGCSKVRASSFYGGNYISAKKLAI